MAASVVEGDQFLTDLCALLQERDFTGAANELLTELGQSVGISEKKDMKLRGWPAGNRIRGRLNMARPSLLKHGIQFKFSTGHAQGRTIWIWKSDRQPLDELESPVPF